MSRADARRRAGEMMDVFDLRAKATTRAPKLSGGMRRRLLLARALMHEPRLVILDEPTAGVDFELRLELWRYIRRLHEEGTTILLTTHYLEEAEELCEDIALIREGRLIARDTADGLRAAYDADSLADVYVKAMAAGALVKLTIVGGGGFRVPLVYGALLAKRETLPFDEVVLHDLDAGPDGADGGGPARARRRSAARSCRSAPPPTSTTRSRAPTSCSPRSASAGSRAAWSTRRCRSRSACSGRRRPGPAASASRCARSPRWSSSPRPSPSGRPAPGSSTSPTPPAWSPRRCSRCSATAWSASATRRAASAGASPARSAATRARCGSTTSASTTSAGCAAPTTPTRDRLPELLADDATLACFEEGRLFGGDWLRALGMIPNEYLYYFYFHADAVESIRKGGPRGA